MRTLNSAKNLISSLGITLTMIFLGFITRKVFVDNIGIEYLGLNGLLQNILGVMSLLEGGFATSVVYNLYKPLAENDQPKIIALLQLYKKVYRYIALGICICALIIYPFINYFIKDADSLSYVSIVYFIFLFNSIIQYFTAYKWSIINASQKLYKLTTINLIYQVGLNITKLAILYYTQNYILYLVIESIFGIGLNIAIVKTANHLFPYLLTKKRHQVDTPTKKNIITNMKALFLHSVGGYFMHSTDNIVISTFVGVSTVGIYSNYTLILGTIGNMVAQILNSFSESVGNLIAMESSDKIYHVFQTIFFVNFLVISIPIIIIHNTITPFIQWWLGDEYVLGYSTMCIILINFYINNMRNSALTFKTKAGIFIKDRYTPLLQGIINLTLSLIFVRHWGLSGVLAATAISILSIGFWQFPRLIYKYTFRKSLWNYFKMYIFYTIAGFSTLLISFYLCQFNNIQNLLFHTIFNGVISICCILVIFYALFYKTNEFIELKSYTFTAYKNLTS